MNSEKKTPADIETSFSGRGVYPVEYAGWLLTPLRRFIFRPGRMVQLLQLKPGDRVLEIGPGPGYFSPAVARAVPQGKLVLCDVQAGMIEIARKRLLKRKLINFECQVGSATALPFVDNTFDIAFMVTVLGEVGENDARVAAVREAARILRPGGLFSVTEQLGDPDYVRVSECERLGKTAGLSPEKRVGPRFFYTYNFRKTT